MMIYLLKSAGCLALLLAFYHLVLEKEKMHNFNRFYLLGSILFSFLAPLFIIYIDADPIIIQGVTSSDEFYPIENNTTEVITENPIDYISILIGVYSLISFILLIRFGKNLTSIINKIKHNSKVKYESAILVLVDDVVIPHTFWNYIFVNKSDYFNEKIEQELFTHELTHATQKHTFDVLILEIIHAIFWINPLYILCKKAIQLNHEFLADENVIHQHKNTHQYQYLLINKAAWKNEYYLASNLNYLVTKKRLKMMTTQSSYMQILLKKLAVIPLLAGFVFLFAERVEAQEVIVEEKETPLETIYEEVTNSGSNYTNSELYKEYVYSKGRYSFRNKDGKTTSKKYSELTDEEKKRLIPPPPLKSKKKIPTQELLNQLKDEKKYAVWIDGEVINNSTLSNYKSSDFAHHFVSFVHKNARSKKFPQEYQAQLQTKKYFLLQNKKRVNDFLNYLKDKKSVEEVQEEAIPVIIEKQKKKYNSPSSNGSKQRVIKKPFYIDASSSLASEINTGFKTINNTVFYFVTVNGKTKFYNKEGKPFDKNGKLVSNKKAKASEIMPDNYVKRVFYKGNVFCEFVDDKPNLKEQTLEDLVNESKVKSVKSTHNNNPTIKLIEKLAKKGAKFYYENKLISSAQALELVMKNPKIRVESESTNNSNYVARLFKDEVKKSKQKQSIEGQKKRNKLDVIIDMAKNDADFYYEKQPISSDKAIELLKKDNSLNVHSEVSDFYSFKVWISKNKKESSATKPKLSDFEIDMKKQSNKVILKCNYGCDWKELTFTLKDDQLRTNINQFGKSKDKNADSSFWFYINYNFGRVELHSNKGAAWKQLGFNLTTSGKINQFGVKRR